MAKQKVVIKLSIGDKKRRSKALQTAVGLPGVISAEVDGDKLVVVGEGVDAVRMTVLLRKNLGYAQLDTVAAVEEKKEEKKPAPAPAPAKAPEPVPWAVHPACWTSHCNQPAYTIFDWRW